MHSLEQFDRSALGLLAAVDKKNIMVLGPDSVFTRKNLTVVGAPFGALPETMEEVQLDTTNRVIFMLHELVWDGPIPSWARGAENSQELLEDLSLIADLVLTGDNHKNFTAESNGHVLINPGSMMRATADQENTQPQCYLYFADDNSVQAVDYPIEKGVHQRDHLDRVAERDNRIAAYIERINTDWKLGVSFQNNLESFFNENEVPPPVREIIYTALGKGE